MRSMGFVAGFALLVFLAACGGGGGDGAPPPIEVTTLAASGPGSLADAVSTAAPGTTITFASGLAGAIDLSAGGLVIDRSVTIRGPGAGQLALSGDGATRVLEVTATGNATVADLEITLGSGVSGAGARNAGVLTLERVVVSQCTTLGVRRGGGIQNFGTLTCTDCTIRDCQAFNGAGFTNDGGTMTLRRCAVYGNTTTGNSGGGGINSDGTLLAVNCTFHDNHTTGSGRDGGAIGIFSDTLGTQTTLLSCTISGNSATGAGGGLYAEGDNGPPPVLSTVRIEGCIVAANLAMSGGPDVDLVEPEVVVLAARNNVVGVDTNSTMVHGVDGNQVGTAALPLDPLLGTLADNGGPTESLIPAPGSPARDAVPAAACLDLDGAPLTGDQRGLMRPIGAACDAGSIESL